MQDLDLDELHQAVSKMMDKPKAAKRQTSRPAERGHGAAPAVRPAPRPNPMPVDPPANTDTDAATPVTVRRPMPRVPERKRTHPGAMDIIQPAGGPKITPPSQRPKRVAQAVHPTGPVQAEPHRSDAPQEVPAVAQTPGAETDVTDEMLASLSMQDEKPAQTLSLQQPDKPEEAAQKQSTADWPDPLDFHDFDEKPTQEPQSQQTPDKPSGTQSVSIAASAEPTEVPPTMDSAEEPLAQPAPVNTTPFVTTKVEKRPLGAYAAVPQAETPPVAPAPTPAHASEGQAQPGDTPAPAAEADADVPSKSELARASLKSDQHLAQPGEPEDKTPDDLRQMSIPQQYHVAPSQPSERVHSLYDTKEYQAPPQVMHTARKGGSPWLTVVVVVLIALAVVAAVVAYLMVSGIDPLKLW